MIYWITFVLVIIAYYLDRRHGENYAIKRVERILLRKQIQLERQDKELEKAERS